MKILMLTSFVISSYLTHAHHPIMIMILIISQTLNMCLILWIIMPSAWFAFILFLIFIGGLMVLFIYITSLAANETFNININMTYKQMTTTVVSTLVILTASILFCTNNFNSYPLNKQITMMFSYSLSVNTIIIMTYLLVTLIVVVKISTKIKGPIRNIIKNK